MLNKKYLVVLLLILIVCIVPHASAADDSNNLTQTDSAEDIEFEYSGEEDVQTAGNENSGKGTFTDLNDLIYKNYALDLEKDYLYNDDVDADYFRMGVQIEHEITINGNGHTIEGNVSRIFQINSNVQEVKIYNLTFKNNYFPSITSYYSISVQDNGGAIFNLGQLYLENCTFIGNHANYNGGAIVNAKGCELIVNNCTFTNNSIARITDAYGGGAIMSRGKLIVLDSKFYGNFAKFGGAICAYNETVIRNSYFEDNVATISGGALFNYFPNVCEAHDSSFYGNQAQQGGALFAAMAINCSFSSTNYASAKKGHIAYLGAIFNCTCDEVNTESLYYTANSTGLSFEPKNLIFQNGGYNKTLEFSIITNPDNVLLESIMLNIDVVDKNGKVANYQIISDEYGKISIPLSNFSNGSYQLKVSFQNRLYNTSTVNYTLSLGITYSKVSFSAGMVFEYGGSGSIYVIVDGGFVEKKNIHVVGHSEAKIDFADRLITVSGLNVGKYTLSVETTPDENHFSTVGTIGINVKKAVAVIKASKLTVALKRGTYWSIMLVDSKNNKPIANMQLTLKVYTGKKFKKVTISTNSKGEAKYKTSKLSKGNHKVVVIGSHPGYSFNTVTSSIKVIKPKALKFKLHKRINDNEGSLISYVVKDKKTKKGINGVKVKLLIYTGKKVKTVMLKTKKSGKFNGAMGFATNELSVGKHKVKVVPASIKYSGSAKTTMIIKKSAKKRQSFSNKL